MKFIDIGGLTRKIVNETINELLKISYNIVKSWSSKVAKSSCMLLLKILIVCSILFLLIIGAVCIYAFVFWTFIPITFQSVPVQLQSQLTYKQGIIDVGDSLVISNERYDVSITLELPESETNFELGNFDVEVNFNERQVIRGIGILKYRSPIIRTARSFLFLLPILTGIWEESQVVKIALQTEIQNTNDIQKVEVKLFPKELQVYNISLQLEVKLTGIRYMIHKYYYTSWMLGSAVIFLLESLAVLYLLYLYRNQIHKMPSIPLNKQIIEKVKQREHVISKADWILPNERELTMKCLIPVDFSSIIKEPIRQKAVYQKWLQKFGIRNYTIN